MITSCGVALCHVNSSYESGWSPIGTSERVMKQTENDFVCRSAKNGANSTCLERFNSMVIRQPMHIFPKSIIYHGIYNHLKRI